MREWASTDVDELDQLAAPSTGMRTALHRPRTSTSQPCRNDVRCDRDLLRAFAAEADTVEAYQDPKLAAAVEELAAIAAQAELREPSPTAEETLS